MTKAGHVDGAADTVRAEGVPLWRSGDKTYHVGGESSAATEEALKLAPRVRRVMLDYQDIVATRNDLGQLASMHTNLVRLALVGLRLSVREYLGDLPAEVEEMCAQSNRRAGH